MSFRLEKPDHQSHTNQVLSLCPWLSQNPSAASLGVGAEAKLCMGSSHSVGSCSETPSWKSWALTLAWNSRDFPTSANLVLVELAAFQIWLHCLFFLASRESCILTQPYWPLFQLHCCSLGHSLQMHYFSGYLITKILLFHCLNFSLLSDLATSVLALVQLPSPSDFCLWYLSRPHFFS